MRTIHFSYSSTKTVGATVLGGLWALEWSWHIAETNLRCVRSSGICMPNLNSLAPIVSEISAFIRTDRQTDIARSTRLVILIKNIYTLWGRKRFLLPVTYFPTKIVYPFTLRVTGMKTTTILFVYPCRGYYDFSQKCATQWRRRFRPHKVHIFLISITRRVDLAMYVCSSVSTKTTLSFKAIGLKLSEKCSFFCR